MVLPESLRTFRLFQDVAASDLIPLAAHMERKSYRPNFRDGEPADALYLVELGTVELFNISLGVTVLATVGTGGRFGDVATAAVAAPRPVPGRRRSCLYCPTAASGSCWTPARLSPHSSTAIPLHPSRAGCSGRARIFRWHASLRHKCWQQRTQWHCATDVSVQLATDRSLSPSPL